MAPSPHHRLAFALLCLVALGPLSAGARTHIVQPGETVDGIAKKYRVPRELLIQYNALREPDRLAVGQILRVPEPENAKRTYVVQPGDTLGTIAVDHNVSALALANHNRLADPDNLVAGQALEIPSAAPAPALRRSYPLPADLRKRIDATRVTPGRWKYIVIHHSGTLQGSARDMDAYHRRVRHMENGLAYHFVIGNGLGMKDGGIEIGNRWKRQIKGGHLASDALNEISLGICLVGNFETGRPTQQQLKSLYALVQYLLDRCRATSGAVKTHRQINTRPTVCPGRNFPRKSLMENI
jgi:LysM repeat protein